MARDFSKTIANNLAFGAGAFGSVLNKSQAISMAAWCYFDTFSAAAQDNRIISSCINGVSTSGLLLSVGSTTNQINVGGRSVQGDSFRSLSGTTVVPTGRWVHIGGILEFPTEVIEIYLDGQLDGQGTGGAWTNNVYTLGTPTVGVGVDRIGGPAGAIATTGPQVDGRIGQVSLWGHRVSAGAFEEMASGVSALDLLNASQPSLHISLDGDYDPELEIISGDIGTIAGSLPVIDSPPSTKRNRSVYFDLPTGGPAANPFFFNRHVLSRRAA